MGGYVDYTLSKVQDRANTWRFDVDAKNEHIGHLVFEVGQERNVKELELTPDPHEYGAIRQHLQRLARSVARDVPIASEA